MADIYGTNLANAIVGTTQNDRIYGLDGDDNLKGAGGNDELYGGAGNDTLWGDAGADLMFGGSGNDTYYVDDVGDVVSEQLAPRIDDGGIDRVYSTITYTFGAFIERATLTGTFSGDLTGNDQANTLTGNGAANTLSGGGGIDELLAGAGDDRLIGGAGKDNLTGGTGSDTFVFGPADATSTDRVKDFAAEDLIGLAANDYGLTLGNGLINNGFGALALDPDYFATISGTGTIQGTSVGHGQFLFNTTTLTLLWDADGAGSSAAGIAIATFNAGTVLSPSSFSITPPTAVVGNISINNIIISEGNSGTRTATFIVSRTGTVAFTIDFATADGTAIAGSDYQANFGTLVFADGQLSQTITVIINGDISFEPNETFFLNLLNPTNGGVIIEGNGLGTISNDDAPPSPVGNISVTDVTSAEENSGTHTITFTVSRTGTAAFSVDFATADGTAFAGSDYAPAAGTLAFADGQLTQTITVTINGDMSYEANETFFLNLTNPSNGGVIVDTQGIGTITNDDAAPPIGQISVSDISIIEGNSGSQTVTFTVSRTGTAAFSVDFATADGTAFAGSDYGAIAGTLNFATGQLTQTITVSINGDLNFEPNETFFLNLSNATMGGIIVDNQAVATITNDDNLGSAGLLSVSDASVLEGDTGVRTLTFTVSRTGTAACTVDFATANGTANAGSDYVHIAGTLYFAAGQVSQTVTVTIASDLILERNETLFLNLSNASVSAGILDYQGLGTITNGDPSILIADITGTVASEDLTGNVNANRIFGLSGNDRLYAKAGDDVLFGGSGNDRLDGGTGIDTMFGGAGDDLYRVDDFGDVVSEESFEQGVDDGGIDTVESTISSTLGDFVEKLTLTGGNATNGAGNATANTIKGNDAANVLSGMAGDDDLRGNGGDDTLVGGGGKDTLTGGTGNDVFVFGPADPTGIDRVVDFTSGTDKLRFLAANYGLSEGAGLTNGALDTSYFALISGTQNQGTAFGHGQFLYNTTSRTLFWDADGAGAGMSGVAIATFSPVNSVPVTLSYSDLAVVSALPTVSVANSSNDPTAEGQQAIFVVSLSTVATQDVYIRYSAISGTATSGTDFVGSTDNFAVIRAGTISTAVGVSILIDSTVENGTETFALQILGATLVDGTSLVVDGSQTTGLIFDRPNQVINVTSTSSYGCVDPSGLAYVPGIGLFIADSEVEESPFNRTNNLFRVQTDGSAPAQFSLLNFTDEPTGLAYDTINNRLYITDDDQYKVFWVDPANPTVKLGEFRVPIAADDPEDIAFNPNTGTLFISNGLSHSIVEIDSSGVQIGAAIILPSFIVDPEALLYDAQHDVFFVTGGFTHLIWRVDRSGNVLETIDVLAGLVNPVSGTSVHIKDMEFAPTSDPNDDPSLMSLYVADYGNTHLTPALCDDGRLIEVFINNAPVDPGYWV